MTGSNDHSSEQNITSSLNTTMCRNGCGFYGSSSNDGMCSKCFKDNLKRTQHTPTASKSETILTNINSNGKTDSHVTIPIIKDTLLPETGPSTLIKSLPSIIESTSTSPPDSSIIESSTPSIDTTDSTVKKVKKNRCTSCKKKVGLTGFTCRCGGLYCSEHRYSDKHSCTFDYHEMAQSQIRKANPVVMGSKVDKI